MRAKISPDIARRVDRRQPACRFVLPRTPFSPARKPDDDKEEDAGILAYVKDDDAVSADFHLGSLQNRKTLQGKEDAPQRGGLPEAKRRVSTTGAEVASDAKVCVSLSSEGVFHSTYLS